MTIQLTAPILEAGVEQATGTQLTLSADREAELVNRGVAVYTSRSPATGEDLVQISGRRNPAGGLLEIVFEGNSYAAIPLDENGNAMANVNHRTGTLAALLALAGGDGEISKATDIDAIVVHNGVALEAKAYHRSSKIAELHVHGTIASLVGGTAGVVDLTSKTVDYGGMTVDLANNKFQPPVGTKYVKATIYISVTDADVTAGTKFTAYVDYYVSGFGWSYLIGQELFEKNPMAYMQASGDAIALHGVTTVDLSSLFDRSPGADEGYIQLRILHGDATDAYANVAVSAVFEFFGKN